MPHITFVAHGSSLETANDFFRRLIAKNFDSRFINIGFLEKGLPSLSEALEKQIRNGAKKIRVIPLLLAPGNHTTRDIPELVKKVAAKNPFIKIEVEDFIGNRKEFIEILKKL